MNYEIDIYDRQGKGKIIDRRAYSTENQLFVGSRINTYSIIQDRADPIVIDQISESVAMYPDRNNFSIIWSGQLIRAHFINEDASFFALIEDKKQRANKLIAEEIDEDMHSFCIGYLKGIEGRGGIPSIENEKGIFESFGYKSGRNLFVDKEHIRRIWIHFHENEPLPIFFSYIGL